jgi:predicted small lipoprotein YifL
VRDAPDNDDMRTLMIVIALLALTACERKGPAEKAGAAVDRAVDKTGRAVEKAGENVQDAVNGKK